MKILLDTNVVLDIILKREPFFKDALSIYQMGDEKKAKLYITANSVTDIIYIATKNKANPVNRELLDKILLKLFDVIDIIGVDKKDILNAFDFSYKDYEDALQAQCAIKIKTDYIVTRNTKDFDKNDIKVMTPEEFLKSF